ncbi:Protein of unknown function [Gryllus bimaculatus]|nr:Protein of unknown function [Gryllus bimaculatus]
MVHYRETILVATAMLLSSVWAGTPPQDLNSSRLSLLPILPKDSERSSSPTGYLYPHRRSDMCLVVKRRRRRVQQGILQVFSSDSWTATGVGLAAFAGALWLIGRRKRADRGFRRLHPRLFVTREREPAEATGLFRALSAFGLVMVSAFITGRFMGLPDGP